MKLIYTSNPTSNVIRVKLMNSSVTTGAGLTGLSNTSSGLNISIIGIESSATTSYATSSVIDTIATLGTFSAATAGHCRFKEVDATNHPGVYELQFNDSVFSGHASIILSITGATNLAQFDTEIQCGNLPANMNQILGTAVSTPATAGILDVNVKNAGGTAWASGAITDAVYAAATTTKANRTATAQAGAASSITLDSSAVSANNYYVPCIISIASGTGAGQSRLIVYYIGSSKIAYVHRPWVTNPDSSSVFVISPVAALGIRTVAGLAQAGTSTSITFISSENSVSGVYNGMGIKISGGTGIGQIRTIVNYNGATKVATIDRAWVTTPDTTSLYELLTLDAIGPQSILHGGTAQAGDASTITIASAAVSADNYYDGNIIQIVAGTGVGQSKIISSYVGSTRVATVSEAWATQPDNTSVYIIRGLGDVEVGVNNDKSGYGLSGTPNVNVTQINSVSTSAVTAVNANQGMTQPINFTGTGTSALVKSDIIDVASVSAAATKMSLSAPTMITGTVASAGLAPTTMVFQASDITTSAANFYSERTVIFISGALQNQARSIIAYSLVGGRGQFTVDTLTSAPANGDTFIIV